MPYCIFKMESYHTNKNVQKNLSFVSFIFGSFAFLKASYFYLVDWYWSTFGYSDDTHKLLSLKNSSLKVTNYISFHAISAFMLSLSVVFLMQYRNKGFYHRVIGTFHVFTWNLSIILLGFNNRMHINHVFKPYNEYDVSLFTGLSTGKATIFAATCITVIESTLGFYSMRFDKNLKMHQYHMVNFVTYCTMIATTTFFFWITSLLFSTNGNTHCVIAYTLGFSLVFFAVPYNILFHRKSLIYYKKKHYLAFILGYVVETILAIDVFTGCIMIIMNPECKA